MNDKEFKLADRLVLKLRQCAFSKKPEVRVKALEELNGEEKSPGLFSQWEKIRRERESRKPKNPPKRDESGKFIKTKTESGKGGDRGSAETIPGTPPPLPPPNGENPRPPKTTMEVMQVTEEYILELVFESVNSKDAKVTPLPVDTVQVRLGATANVAPVIEIPKPTEEMLKHKLTVNQVRAHVFKRVV